MKMHRLVLVGFMAGLSALAFTSCAYDPYYSYSGGYGDGYGYGGSGFSTSYFVSTGSSRWAYDPYAGAYYDHTRRCYYDPYLNGYYPIGYRPRYVYGAPHPHGWSSGSRYCPAPSGVRSYTLTNYHDRSERYRDLGQDWSRNVRISHDTRDDRSHYGTRSQPGSLGGWTGSSNHDRDGHSPYGGRSYGGDSRSRDSSFGNQRDSHTNWLQQRSGGDSLRDTRSDGRSSFQRSGGESPFGRENNGSSDRGGRDFSRGGSFDRGGNSPAIAPQPRVEPRIEPQVEPRRVEPQAQPQAEPRGESQDRGHGDSLNRGRGGRLRGLGEG